MITRDKQRENAIIRMKMLDICPEAIEALEKHDQLAISVDGHVGFYIKPEISKQIKEFEKKFNSYIYHCIYSTCEFGIMYNLLYISKYENEWLPEMMGLQNGISTAHVLNESHPERSESGLIRIQPSLGGLIRIY